MGCIHRGAPHFSIGGVTVTDKEIIERHIDHLLKSKQSANKLAPKYLIFSFAYYILAVSFIDDSLYDAICHYLYENYDELAGGWKKYIDKDALGAGTAFHLAEKDYPCFCSRVVYGVLRKGWCFD